MKDNIKQKKGITVRWFRRLFISIWLACALMIQLLPPPLILEAVTTWVPDRLESTANAVAEAVLEILPEPTVAYAAPHAWDTGSSWSSSCTDPNGQIASIYGMGTGNYDTPISSYTPAVLAIPNGASANSMFSQAYLRGSGATNVTFTSPAPETVVVATSVGTTGASQGYMQVYQTDMLPANQVTADVVGSLISQNDNGYLPRSFVTYAFHPTQSQVSSGRIINFEMYYNWDATTHTESFTLPPTTGTRNIDIVFVISELENDTRVARLSASAGSVSQSVDISVPNMGDELLIYTMTLANVPGTDTNVVTTATSPPNASGIEGDSFVWNSVQVTTDEVCPTPDVLLGDRVWIEDDNDGDATSGVITPVVGATVTATASDGTTYTDVTDASGNYTISVPADSVYTVTVSTPAGTTPAGTLITTDSDPTTQNDRSHDGSGTVVTVGTEDNLTIDFGFYESPPPPPCGTDSDDLGGTIWRDYNSDGIQDATELGFDGVIVTAYDNDGNAVTTTVNSDGTYTFSDIFATETHIRLEFSGLPSWMESGVHGSDSGTTVQIHTAATCDADLAVQNPADYCDENPLVSTACYVNGVQNGANDVLVALDYDATGPVQHVSTANQIGSTWGIAYQRETQTLFASAILKRHAGFGPGQDGALATADDISAIYVIDYSSPGTNGEGTVVTSRTIDLSDFGINVGTDPRLSSTPTNDLNGPADANRDYDVHENVGRLGIGGMHISEDEQTLYLVNINTAQPQLVALDISDLDNIALASAPVNIPDPGCPGNDTHAPWAVHVHDGEVYVGVVCTADDSADAANLRAYVQRLDGTSLVNIDLDSTSANDYIHLYYDRGCTYLHTTLDWCSAAEWRAWHDTWIPMVQDGATTHTAQPILSDLTFGSDGSLTLGLMDRTGHQTGYQNYQPDTSDTELYSYISGGDLFKLCNVNDQFVPEGNVGCVQNFSNIHDKADGDDIAPGVDNLANPGLDAADIPFEFYQDNTTLSTADDHGESFMGGMALLPNTDHFVATYISPAGDHSNGGFLWQNESTGAQLRGTRLYTTTGSAGDFYKANGLGDVALMCAPAPLEIGNYVWMDDDGDGIQDPCEPGISGVDVVLIAADGSTQTVTTDADGEYYFPVESNSAYTLTIDMTQPELITATLTTPNVDAGTTLPDGIDSDAIASGDLAVITLTTGDAGENDHTFDFGFVPESPQVLIGDRVWIEDDGDGDATTGIITPVVGSLVTAIVDYGTAYTGTATVYTTTTDVNGYYTIPVPINMTYTVSAQTPVGMTPSSPIGGNLVTDITSDNDLNHVSLGTTVVVGTEDNLTVDFGFYEPPPPTALCYAVGDESSIGSTGRTVGTADPDILIAFDGYTGVTTNLGHLSSLKIEAIEFDPNTGILYAADADTWGSIDLATNTYNMIGSFTPFTSTVNGSLGPQAIIDVDGIGYDPVNDLWYGTERNGGNINGGEPDLLFQFDPTTGAVIPNAFGPGVDYVRVEPLPNPDDPLIALHDIDDLGFDPASNRLYGIANIGISLQTHLVIIDRATGDTTDLGRILYNGSPLFDIEGLTIDPDGRILVSTGNKGLVIDPDTGVSTPANSGAIRTSDTAYLLDVSGSDVVATLISTEFGLNQNPGGDYEALTCMVYSPPVIIGDTVWYDDDGDGSQNGGETGISGVIIELLAPDGTVAYTTTTSITGTYLFEGLPPGQYTVTVSSDNFLPGNALEGHIQTGDPDGTMDDQGTSADLLEGESDLTLDFGYRSVPMVLIGDRVWIEDDNDGLATTGVITPVVGTVVTAVGSDGIIYTDTTDAMGYYTITVPANDVYTVTVGTPAGTVVAVPAGGLVATDNDPTTNDDTSHDPAGTVVTVGTVDNLTIDFGFYELPPSVPSLVLSKVLNTPPPARVNDVVSFTIRITNTGATAITTVPLIDTYNSAYLTYVTASPLPDVPTQGELIWHDLTAAGASGFGMDLDPGASFEIVVEFLANLDTTGLPNDSAINLASSQGISDTAEVPILAPTSVQLAIREAIYKDGKVALQWETADETDVAGFHIYRQLVGSTQLERLTQYLLVSEKSGSSSGAAYTYEDATAEMNEHYRYFVGILDTKGLETQEPFGNVLTQRTVDEWLLFLPFLMK